MNDLKELDKLIGEMDSLVDSANEIHIAEVETIWNVDIERAKILGEITSIEDVDLSKLVEYLFVKDTDDNIAVVTKDEEDNYIVTLDESVAKMKSKNEDFVNKTDLEYLMEMIKSLYNSFRSYNETLNESQILRSDQVKIHKEFVDYFNSDDYKEKKNSRISKLREAMDNEEDPDKKNKMKATIDEIESFQTLNFLFEYIDGSEHKVENMIHMFFNYGRSSYVVTRFKNKIAKFGPSISNMYKSLFNIERKFLPEQYKPMNNLFLFGVMHFIAYIDVYSAADRVKTTTLLLNLFKLAYHQCKDDDYDDLINLIKNFDDMFIGHIETFKEKNITYLDSESHIDPEDVIETINREKALANEIEVAADLIKISKSSEETVVELQDDVIIGDSDIIEEPALEVKDDVIIGDSDILEEHGQLGIDSI